MSDTAPSHPQIVSIRQNLSCVITIKGSTSVELGTEENVRHGMSHTSRSSSFPAAAFRNPFRDGAPEIVRLEQTGQGGHLVHLSNVDTNIGLNREVLFQTASDVDQLVTVKHQGTVTTYWTGQDRKVWRSRLTRNGFAMPSEVRWAAGTRVLGVTYLVLKGGTVVQPHLYGITWQTQRQPFRLWLRRPSDVPEFFPLLDPPRSEDRIVLSMTGIKSWVIDACIDGNLRRWKGRSGGTAENPRTRPLDSVVPVEVIGACRASQPHVIQPMFIGHRGQVYMQSVRTEPIRCIAETAPVRRAELVQTFTSEPLLYTAADDGRLAVTWPTLTDEGEVHWGATRVISTNFDISRKRLIPFTHPEDTPGFFVIDEKFPERVTLHSMQDSDTCSEGSRAGTPWWRLELDVEELEETSPTALGARY
ncbi:hypothetical protein [Streptomyces sp. S816]|uniref:hypothetical protein n=1 Tax=Streptomyces sp. S816 TaxID=2283197 RepID=UPI00109D4AB0|nr:hypothetical protein [Streptomyces sp. S816]